LAVRRQLDLIPTGRYSTHMIDSHSPRNKPEGARLRLLDAALRIIREKGYHATSVDELCAAAGVTKGGFFHHFKSKQDLAVAAADYWSETTGGLFAQAPYHAFADPLDRIIGYLDFRIALITGTTAEFTCLVGTMVQEAFLTNPAIRDACCRSITGHAEVLEVDLAAAIGTYGVSTGVTAKSLALHTQAVLQGAFLLAKAKNDPAIASESIRHLGRYLSTLFRQERPKEEILQEDTVGRA
jgi:TetR/AcrR family transcriptional regulator, transcriptional repressor for nem operon